MILILYIVLTIGLLIGLQWLRHKWTQFRQTRDLENTFRNSSIRLPTIEFGSNHRTTCSITFSTKADLELAESSGLIDQFKRRIRTYYGNEFDPDSDVYFTYIGQREY
jgi:hypothetical protein